MRRLKLKDKKRKRKTIISLLFLGATFTFLVGVSYRFYSLARNAVWDGKNRLNLVFQAKPVFIISFSPSEASLQTLVIPEGTLIEVIYDRGFYRAESIYQLGELEGQGGEFLTASLQEYLGLPIDGFIAMNDFPQLGELKSSITQAIADLLFKRGGKTNLAGWDLFRLWWEIQRLKTKEVKLMNLKETDALLFVVLPDGSRVAKINLERFDRITQPLFADEKIRAENLTVVVLNGTSYPGLARRGARLITNMGGRVIGVGEKEEEGESRQPARRRSGSDGQGCEVRSQEGERNSYTVKKIIKLFGCQWGGENLEEQRAEVVVILGEDYRQKFTPHHSGMEFTR